MAWQWPTAAPVSEVIGDRLTLTIVVSLAAVIFTWLVAVPIGIYSATHQYSVGDYFFTFIGFIGLAIPGFLLALILLYFGYTYFDADIGGLFSAEYLLAPWSMARVLGPDTSTCLCRLWSWASAEQPA